VLDWVNVTVVPDIGLLFLSLALMVKVPVGVPLEDNEEGDASIVSVEPVICTGNEAVAVPDVAVMVAVRFAWFANPKPEENVTVPLPVASVMMVEELSWPLLVLRVIVAPVTDALLASIALTVIVEKFELSVNIVEGVPEICMVATGAVPVAGGVVVVPPALPPALQPAINANTIAEHNHAENLASF
jgi:hypothetical protein